MLHADLQGLQGAARQLLLHAGQRELPAPPSICSFSWRRAALRGALHSHGEPSERRGVSVLQQLQQLSQAGHELRSAVPQVRLQAPLTQTGSPSFFFLTEFLFFSVLFFLGRSADEMRGQSWYSLMHPEDLSPAANSHTKLSRFPYRHRLSWCSILK